MWSNKQTRSLYRSNNLYQLDTKCYLPTSHGTVFITYIWMMIKFFFFLQKILKSNFNICIYFGEYFLEDTTQGTDKVQLNLKNLYRLSIFLRNYLLYGNGKQTEIKINDKNLY